MITAWIITFSVLLLCISATIIIFDGIKQTDAKELADFQSQLKNMAINTNKEIKKVS